MSDDKFHFEIPKENVRIEKYEKYGYSIPVDRTDHSEHGKALRQLALKFREYEERRKDARFTQDLFLQIETPEPVSLKSQKSKIEQLGFEILSYSFNSNNIGVAKINKTKFETFSHRLEEYINTPTHDGKTYFAPIERLNPIPVEDKIDQSLDLSSSDEIDVIINLYQSMAARELLAINAAITGDLRRVGRNVQQRIFTNGVSSFQCALPAAEIAQLAQDYSSIREIRLSGMYFVPQSVPSDSLPSSLQVKPPLSNSTVCIIDSGVSTANGIMKDILSGSVEFLPTGSIGSHLDHGTFVGSRCAFGDQIDACLGTQELVPYFKLYDVAVFGRNAAGNLLPPSEFMLNSAIEDVVVKHHADIKVYNLSLGASTPIRNSDFSDTAKLLDFLSKEYKVLFIVAAGNIRTLLGTFPVDHFGHLQSRIGSPAESLLALTVGAIAKHADSSSLSPRNCISPFSKIGPGADLGVKPELVAHGGNFMAPYSFSPRGATYGLSKDGLTLAKAAGTSHSAPLIAQYAQRLFDAYPNSQPNLVKALLCHFAEERDVHPGIIGPKIKYIGFGEPNIEMAISAGTNNAAFIYEGQIDQDNYQIIRFHVPNALAQGMQARLKIRVTITYDPPVSPDNSMEYSRARMSASLWKPTNKGMKAIAAATGDKYNVPWNPIIQFEKSFVRNYLTGPWELKLRLYTRDIAIQDYLQDYSVVIELMDETGSTDVHTTVTQEFGDIYKKIEIKKAA